jgi:hypothetical protein
LKCRFEVKRSLDRAGVPLYKPTVQEPSALSFSVFGAMSAPADPPIVGLQSPDSNLAHGVSYSLSLADSCMSIMKHSQQHSSIG